MQSLKNINKYQNNGEDRIIFFYTVRAIKLCQTSYKFPIKVFFFFIIEKNYCHYLKLVLYHFYRITLIFTIHAYSAS